MFGKYIKTHIETLSFEASKIYFSDEDYGLLNQIKGVN